MMYEKLVYTNERGESIELSVGSVYHCNVSRDVAAGRLPMSTAALSVLLTAACMESRT